MSKIIGIDLGTSNSIVTVWENGHATLIPNSLGESLTPSVVSFGQRETIYVGKIAKERLISHPNLTIGNFKRFMGTNKNYEIDGKNFRPEELSAIVLRSLKEDAERYLGMEVVEAIVSVPAYFNDMARKATKDAGALAGLKVERIINEPSAAALAYQVATNQKESTLLVFDLGGGTLDISLVDCFDNIIEIISVSGNNHLGGIDFDLAMANHFCKKYEFVYADLPKEMQETILRSSDVVKQELSGKKLATMSVVYGDFQGSLKITSDDLIKIYESVLLRISKPIMKILSDEAREQANISNVVMVGGASKMPIVQKYLHYLLKERNVDLNMVDPDHMIALGVCAYAGIKERSEDIKDLLLTDICPFSLGCDVHNEGNPNRPYMHTLIERNSALPTSRETYLWTVYDKQKDLRIKVYQGEEVYAEQNIYLGELDIEVKEAPAGEEGVVLRYTYDINGLLIVDVTVNSTQEKKQLLIMNDDNLISPGEIQQRMKALEALKTHPKEKEENRLLIAKAERIYAQLSGDIRMVLAERLRYFEHLMGKQEEYRIQKERKRFDDFMYQIEQNFMKPYETQGEIAEFLEWSIHDMKEDELEEYMNWSNKNQLH